MIDFEAQLRLLESAQGDRAKLALAAVDLAFPSADEAERALLKQALEAAAIPHWCDPAILAALLGVPEEQGSKLVAQLDRLNEAEPFEARGERAINIHEASRLALRKRMASEEPERFRALSLRAAEYFAGEETKVAEIERVYHLLCATPDEGADACAALGRRWSQSSQPQDRDAMAFALHELEKAGLVEGRARLEALLFYAENQYEHSEMTRVAKRVPDALELANQLGDRAGQARARDLLGEVRRSEGSIPDALTEHEAVLQIRRELADAKPDDAIARWSLAVAYSRLGDVHEDRSAHEEALAAFRDCSAILSELAANDPSNARFGRESAVATLRIGDILRDSGETAEARTMFQAALATIGKLAAAEPHSDDWQRDLAMCHLRIGQMDVFERPADARKSLDEYARICRELSARYPGDARFLGDVALSWQWLAIADIQQEEWAEAEDGLAKSREILEELLARDPNMVDWRIGLTGVLSRIAEVHRQQGRLGEAVADLENGIAMMRALAGENPSNVQWRRDLATMVSNLANVLRQMPERKADALAQFEEASRLYASVVDADPDNAQWMAERKAADDELAEARRALTAAAPGSGATTSS